MKVLVGQDDANCVLSLLLLDQHVVASEEVKLLPPRLEDGGDGVVDVVLGVEDNHVRNPPDVADLLFAQLHPSIVDPEVILLPKSISNCARSPGTSHPRSTGARRNSLRCLLRRTA